MTTAEEFYKDHFLAKALPEKPYQKEFSFNEMINFAREFSRRKAAIRNTETPFKTSDRAMKLAERLNHEFELSLKPAIRRVAGKKIKFQMEDAEGRAYDFSSIVLEFMPANARIELTGNTFSVNQ